MVPDSLVWSSNKSHHLSWLLLRKKKSGCKYETKPRHFYRLLSIDYFYSEETVFQEFLEPDFVHLISRYHLVQIFSECFEFSISLQDWRLRLFFCRRAQRALCSAISFVTLWQGRCIFLGSINVPEHRFFVYFWQHSMILVFYEPTQFSIKHF